MLTRRISNVAIVLVLFLSSSFVSANSDTPPQPAVVPNGGWLDQVDIFPVDAIDLSALKAQFDAGEIDVCDSLSNRAWYQTFVDAGYKTKMVGNTWHSLLINTYGQTFKDGRPNPFYYQKVREALNWLVNRDYLVDNLVSGFGTSMVTALTSPNIDHFRNFRTIDALGIKYAFNPDYAKSIISTELLKQGYAQVDGFWAHNGTIANLIFVIRSEGNRLGIGEHIATQLEFAGFKVDRQLATSAGVINYDPRDGLWNIYTGGWSMPFLSRDSGSTLKENYSSSGPYAFSPYFINSSSFENNMTSLAYGLYTNLAQRQAIFSEALSQSVESSNLVALAGVYSYIPYRNTLSISSDVRSGIYRSELLPYVLNTSDPSKIVKLGTQDLFAEPWNPVAGSNWSFDATAQQFMWGDALLTSPRTALNLNNRNVTAQVTAKTGLPIANSSDWVTVSFADSIVVPDDAWVDWDVVTQSWISAGERNETGTLTANLKSVITYPSDLFDKVKWHDGSPLSVADFVAALILPYERGNPASLYYDEFAKHDLDNLKLSVKGYRLVSTNPLSIEFYTDAWVLDAENNVHSFWPAADLGELAWHTLSLGLEAEHSNLLAFSQNKAITNNVLQTNYAFGPAVAVLNTILDEGDISIPFANVLTAYLSPTESAVRTQNLRNFYTNYHHLHLGTGPYYLDSLDVASKRATFKNNVAYSEPAGKWDEFNDNPTNPPTLTVDQAVAGPGSVFNFSGSGYPPYSVQEISLTTNTTGGGLASNPIPTSQGISAETTIIGREMVDGAGKIYFSVQTTAVSPLGTYNVSTSTTPSAPVEMSIDEDAPQNPNPPIGFVYLPLGTFLYLPMVIR